MQPLALGGLDKGQVEFQVMAYFFYVRTYGELAQVLERRGSFLLQLP
jgi:hypothetical protein